jgi:hypothetical protein
LKQKDIKRLKVAEMKYRSFTAGYSLLYCRNENKLSYFGRTRHGPSRKEVISENKNWRDLVRRMKDIS